METSTDVSAEAIRGQLDRILASPGFVHSDRMVRFLRFTVEQTIQGHADSLKESVLGMEVFDRTSSFDPRTDTIVRVEARRLRSKLKEYYETHGQHDAVLIEFPKGSYVPTFLKSNGLRVGEVPTASQAGLHDEAKPSHQSLSTKAFRGPNLAIALALAALLGAGGATLWWRLRPTPAPVEWRLRPLTADSGLTTTPALSPDGKLAGVCVGSGVQRYESRPLGSAADRRLTTNPTHARSGRRHESVVFSRRRADCLLFEPGGRWNLLDSCLRRPRTFACAWRPLPSFFARRALDCLFFWHQKLILPSPKSSSCPLAEAPRSGLRSIFLGELRRCGRQMDDTFWCWAPRGRTTWLHWNSGWFRPREEPR